MAHGTVRDDLTVEETVFDPREWIGQNKVIHILGASRFYTVLAVAAKPNRNLKKFDNLPSTLQNIEQEVISKPKLKLWFSALHSQHEVALCIDFGKKTIAYGKSYISRKVSAQVRDIGDTIPGYPSPKAVIADAQRWLTARFKGPFKDRGNVLRHRVQEDAISCIPGTMNTIACGIFGDELWTPKVRHINRLNWFTKLVPESPRPASPEPIPEAVVTEPSPPSPQRSAIRPCLLNLLNPVEQIAFGDILWSISSFNDDKADPIDDKENEEDARMESAAESEAEKNEEEKGSDLEMDIDTDGDKNSMADGAVPKTSSSASAWSDIFSRKRRTAGSVSSGDEGLTSSKSKAPAKKKKLATAPLFGPVGLSKGARSEKASRQAADEGIFDVEERERWKAAVRVYDPKAEFYNDALRTIRCSNCGSHVKAKYANDTGRFRDHRRTCTTKQFNKKKTKWQVRGSEHVNVAVKMEASTQNRQFGPVINSRYHRKASAVSWLDWCR
ncbi:hypothetical protein C8J56DRAFT_1081916 [Mycena floridula]|nr:hypothetical protein C8J56DRAFT_1081916 [Mycena floridula]